MCKFRVEGIMVCRVKRIFFILLLAGILLSLHVPHRVFAFTFDFSGTVLYDSNASSYICPGFGDDLTGTLSEYDHDLVFANHSSGTSYEDFGDVSSGFFSQGNQNFFYAFSQGDQTNSQMGMIWWSAPESFKIGTESFDNIYGLVFYLDGSLLYTPAQLVAFRLADYFATGYMPTFTSGGSSLPYFGCEMASGTAFLGVIETPFVVNLTAANEPSEVPLPASLWFLGSGLIFYLKRRRR